MKGITIHFVLFVQNSINITSLKAHFKSQHATSAVIIWFSNYFLLIDLFAAHGCDNDTKTVPRDITVP